MRGVACARATLPADVFTKRQFHKDNYEICEDDDDDGDDDGWTGTSADSLLFTPALIAIKFADLSPSAIAAPLTDDVSRAGESTGP